MRFALVYLVSTRTPDVAIPYYANITGIVVTVRGYVSGNCTVVSIVFLARPHRMFLRFFVGTGCGVNYISTRTSGFQSGTSKIFNVTAVKLALTLL